MFDWLVMVFGMSAVAGRDIFVAVVVDEAHSFEKW